MPIRINKKKIVIGLFVLLALCYLAFPLLQFSFNWTKRFLSGQHPFGGMSVHSSLLENLPSIVMEPDKTICCRMKFCDFCFPLPKGSGIITNDPVSGGFDTIKGAIYVTNANGSTLNLQAYSRLIWRNGFRVSIGDDSMFTASSPDGGALEVEKFGHTTKISFSFFGDY